MGFFSSSEITKKEPIGILPKCGACGLSKKCNYVKPEVYGAGRKKILIVTDNTSVSEDKFKEMLVGDTWDVMRKLFRKCDINIKRDCWKTSAVICHSKKNPTTEQAQYCYPNLKKVIDELQPDIILPMGVLALKSVVRETYKEDIGEFARWPGYQIPCQNPNAWVCPLYGPRWLLQQRDKVAQVWFLRHLRAALALEGKPWLGGATAYDKRVQVITNPTKAAKALVNLLSNNIGATFAFDYEANALKPEVRGFKIYSASISNGLNGDTIAFPWRGDVVGVFVNFLHSPKWRKIAANLKYEDRVTRHETGKRVKGWDFDTMLGAHVIDCRQGVTGLKFQAFVQLGAPDYNFHIEKFLKGGDGRINNIHKISMYDLLLYNGLDSLLEYELATKQKKELKIK